MRTAKERLDIKIALLRKGINLTALGRELGVSQPAMSRVIAGASASRKIGRALIKAGVPARLLPEYAENGAEA